MNLTPGKGVQQPVIVVLAVLVIGIPDAEAGIYRWQDHTGTTHYGDSPPTAARKLTELTPTPYDSSGLVTTVLDGDTLILADGRRVRLLGIDAPEVAHHSQPGEPLGEKASLLLKSRALGKPVQLRYDMQYQDRYDRLLAHVYLDDGQNLNSLLLQEGLAYARFEWPNMKYAEEYYAIEKKARHQKLGIWSLPAYQIKPMDNLETLRNRFVRLRGQPVRLETTRRYSYLLFGDKLRVAIKTSRLGLFREAGVDLDALLRKTIVLRGWLGHRRGVPYLELAHPFQLEQID